MAEQENVRTPAGLAVKTIATHAFAIGNYCYLGALQNRSSNKGIDVARIILFTLLPTIIIVECLNTSIRGLIEFIRNRIGEDEEEKNVWFSISAALGVHASMNLVNKTTKEEETKKVPLINLDPTFVQYERTQWAWTWGGKMLATLFALTQAISATIIYARRLDHGGVLDFDHRNGAMGIASIICSVASILILLLRFQWRVEQILQPSTTGRLQTTWTALVLQMFAALLVHLLIAYLANDSNDWLYSSAGVVIFLTGVGTSRGLLYGWQTILLALFIFVFRRDIAAKLDADGKIRSRINPQSLARVLTLLKICLGVWCITDIIIYLVRNVIDVVDNRDWDAVWWSDPISDNLLVV